MEFFDCNTCIGLPCSASGVRPPGMPGQGLGAAELLAGMDHAGIGRALAWHSAQIDYDALEGNEMLAAAIAPHDRLAGCWSLAPTQTGEIANVRQWFARAAAARVKAFRVFPATDRYLLRQEVLGELLEFMIAHRLPLLVSLLNGVDWAGIYDLLRDFPELTLVVCDLNCWGDDRNFRPLIDKYPNVHIEISGYIVDGGIEEFVARYGASRLLFGTNCPSMYAGGPMLMLAGAEISDADKQAIAGGNLQRLLAEEKA